MTKQQLCDYCGTYNEPKSIFSAQKSFVGHKIIDVLQIITQKDLPANLGVKVCFMCASSLMTTMGAIQKTLKMVENASLSKGAGTAKNKKAQTDEPSAGLTADGEMLLNKHLKMRQRSKSMAASSSDLIFPKSPAKNNTSRLEDGLDDSVRLTPAKEVAPNKKVFQQLFGSSPDSGDENDEDEEEATEKVMTLKKDFECKLCNFQTRVTKQFKEHLTKEHGQQRPRIYFCDMCPKTFGVLKSMKLHMTTAHGITVETPQKETKAKVAKPKEVKTKDSKEEPTKAIEKPRKDTNEVEIEDDSQAPKLATIRALNGEAAAKKKWLKNAINNADYTFAVNGSSASTPKAGDNSIDLSNEYKCDICDSVLQTPKQMQEHMKTAHQIDKPKIFKCSVCDKSLSTKQTLKHHMNLHSEGTETEKTGKRKILQDKKSTAGEDDEQPREEKIRHTEEDIKENTADDSLMAPPKTPSKKPKKAKDSPQTIDISDSPSKKGKRKKNDSVNEEAPTVVDLLDEINTNVKPHKKARLESASESICSSIDGDSTADESVLSCNQCDKQVKSHQRLALHIQKRHATKLVCPGCQGSYQSQRDYLNHFAICSSGSDLLPCGVPTCNKHFYKASFLGNHLTSKHKWL